METSFPRHREIKSSKIRFTTTRVWASISCRAQEDTPGVTPQTPGIHSGGANNLQNFPNITSANIVGNQLVISGNFVSDTASGNAMTLDVYVSPTAGSQGYGQGDTFVGQRAPASCSVFR